MEFGYRTNFSLYGNGVTEIIDCEVVSDDASERAGAVLLKDVDTGMAEVAFMDMEGYF